MAFIGKLVRHSLFDRPQVQVIEADTSATPFLWSAPSVSQGWLGLEQDDFVMPSGEGLIGRLGDPVWTPSAEVPLGAPDVDVFDPFDPLDRPEILPAGLESKMSAEADPVICPPGELDSPSSDWAELEAALVQSTRPHHRLVPDFWTLDWVF